MSFAFFDRHRLLRFLLCVIICAVLICLPLFRVQAIAGVDDVLIACFILQTVLVSLGWNMALDPDGTSAMVNEMLGDINEVCSAPLANIAAMIESTWDGHSPYVQVGLAYGDFAMITTAVSTWLAEHMEVDPVTSLPSIEYDQGAKYVFKASDALVIPRYANVSNVIDAVKRFSSGRDLSNAANIKSFLGSSLVYFGYEDRIFPTFIDSKNKTPETFGVANCLSHGDCQRCLGLPIHGTHTEVFSFQGSVPVYPVMSYCTSDEDTRYQAFFSVKYNNAYYFVSASHEVDSDEYYSFLPHLSQTIPVSMLDVPLVGVGGSVSLPYEQDEDYTDGAVVSGWGGLIDKVGDVASTLPFNVPMTGEAAAAATPAIVLPKDIVLDDAPAIDVPGDGTIELPKIGDLTLPVSIIKKFPFCIPFDLVNGLKVLSSPPKEPRFVIPLKYSNIIDEEIVIDFSKFGFVIRLVRWFEVLIFTVGLAAATRQFIKW